MQKVLVGNILRIDMVPMLDNYWEERDASIIRIIATTLLLIARAD